jgi:hypothetical protein
MVGLLRMTFGTVEPALAAGCPDAYLGVEDVFAHLYYYLLGSRED